MKIWESIGSQRPDGLFCAAVVSAVAPDGEQPSWRTCDLKSISLFTQFAADLLACQFATLSWVHLNCDLVLAHLTSECFLQLWQRKLNPNHR